MKPVAPRGRSKLPRRQALVALASSLLVPGLQAACHWAQERVVVPS